MKHFPGLLFAALFICAGGCATAGNLGKSTPARPVTVASNKTMGSNRIRLGAGDGIGAAVFSQHVQARAERANQVLAKR